MKRIDFVRSSGLSLLITIILCFLLNSSSLYRNVGKPYSLLTKVALQFHPLKVREQIGRNEYTSCLTRTSTARSMLQLYSKPKPKDVQDEVVMKLSPSVSQEQQGSDAQQWVSRLILLTVSAFYGTNFGCVKILGDALNPSVAAALRFTLAAAVFLPWLVQGIRSNPQLVRGGLEVGVYNALGYWAQTNALQQADASTVAFICSLAVVLVPILDFAFGAEADRTPTAVFHSLVPALLATAGVACLELGGDSLPGLGDLWALLQPLLFGLGFWRVEHHMKQARGYKDSLAFTGAMLGVVGALSVVWTAHDFLLPQLSVGGWQAAWGAIREQMQAVLGGAGWRVPSALVWTGLVTTALTQLGENHAMKTLDAAESTVIYSTEPLWGTAFAALTLGETVGRETALGAVLILSACAYRSLGVKIAALLPGLQLTDAATIGAIEEVGENIGFNFAELFEKLMEAMGVNIP